MTNDRKQSAENSFASNDFLAEAIRNWKRPSKYFLFFSTLILILVCTTDTVIAKYMNKQKVIYEAGGEEQYFEGPIWQTLISYILEALMILVFLYDQSKAKAQGKTFHFEAVHLHTRTESFNKMHCPFYYWAVPSFLDIVTSLGTNYALVFVHASTLQLLRNSNLLITTALSIVIVRIALRTHQWLGVIITTAGLIIVGIKEIFSPDQNTNNPNLVWVGILFAIFGTSANALQVVIEERLYRTYHVSPYEAMGYFGMFGLIITFIIYGISEAITWNGDKLSRVIYVFGLGTADSKVVIITSFVLMCSICLFNLSGMIVTKLGSCLMRMILISMRTFTIWFVELIYEWIKFDFLSLFGFIITFLGIALYNYDYMVTAGSWKYDAILRKPWMIFSFLKNPDNFDIQVTDTTDNQKSKSVLHRQEEFVAV